MSGVAYPPDDRLADTLLIETPELITSGQLEIGQ
jgi:hypothetical protein